VFSPVTTELELAIPPGWFGYLGSQGRLLAKRIAAYRQQPDDEIVVTVCPILPHKLTKGYGVTRLSVVTHVNDRPVTSLRQMIGLIKNNTDEFIIFRFEDEQEERIVLDPEQVAKYSPEILRNNNIPSAVSEDLADVWP
jgi:hypothetical protein